MLVVSHDRYFLDKIVNRVVEVQDHQLVSYDGNFSEFWQTKQGSTPRVAGRVATRSRSRQLVRAERAADRSALATLERRIQEAEGQKLSLEGQLASREEALAWIREHFLSKDTCSTKGGEDLS